MEMDREHRRLFSSGRGSQLLIMMDADHGKIIQSLPISAGVDAHIFEPETRLLFVSTSPDKPREVETVKIEYGARNIDPKTHNLFLTTADCGPDPAPTKENPHPEREPIPGTFRVLIYGR